MTTLKMVQCNSFDFFDTNLIHIVSFWSFDEFTVILKSGKLQRKNPQLLNDVVHLWFCICEIYQMLDSNGVFRYNNTK